MISDIKNPYPLNGTPSGAISTWAYLADVRNISNMYPYGKSYPATATYSADDDYRYGFNGMEKEKSFDSEGDVADFGARFLDMDFVTFGSPDPYEGLSPNKSTYSFASNSPINAIDVNGETSFFVMGTGYDIENNHNSKLQGTVDYLHTTLATSTGDVDYGFDWSDRNGLFNGPYQWNSAGYDLARYALENNKEGDDITFIGYSYGGAVSVVAADWVYEMTGGKVKVNILTIATPANNYEGTNYYSDLYNSNDFGKKLYKNEIMRRRGNPDKSNGINDMLHFYMTEDGVAGLYSQTYNSVKVSNYQLETQNAPWNDSFWDFLDRAINSHRYIIYEKNIFKETIEKNSIGKQEKVGGDEGSKKAK